MALWRDKCAEKLIIGLMTCLLSGPSVRTFKSFESTRLFNLCFLLIKMFPVSSDNSELVCQLLLLSFSVSNLLASAPFLASACLRWPQFPLASGLLISASTLYLFSLSSVFIFCSFVSLSPVFNVCSFVSLSSSSSDSAPV